MTWTTEVPVLNQQAVELVREIQAQNRMILEANLRTLHLLEMPISYIGEDHEQPNGAV